MHKYMSELLLKHCKMKIFGIYAVRLKSSHQLKLSQILHAKTTRIILNQNFFWKVADAKNMQPVKCASK